MGEGVLASKLIESCDICYQLLLYWMLDPQLAASLCKWLSQLEGRKGAGVPLTLRALILIGPSAGTHAEAL